MFSHVRFKTEATKCRGMMGTRGQMVTVDPISLHPALLQLKKIHFCPGYGHMSTISRHFCHHDTI